MVSIVRESSEPYRWSLGTAPLAEVALGAKPMPDDFINAEGNFRHAGVHRLSQAFDRPVAGLRAIGRRSGRAVGWDKFAPQACLTLRVHSRPAPRSGRDLKYCLSPFHHPLRRAFMIRYVAWFAVAAVCGTFEFLPVEPASAATVIVCRKTATFAEKLAAKEIRRYVYLRCGELLPIAAKAEQGRRHDRPENRSGAVGGRVPTENDRPRGRRMLTISGGSPIAVLYGAYHFAEKLGVRFYLHGRRGPRRKDSLFPSRCSTSGTSRYSPPAASSPSTTSPKAPTGGTRTITRPT